MAFTDRLTMSVSAGGTSLRSTSEYTESGRIGASETIAAAATDVQVNLTVDISALTYIYIYASRPLTIKTNNATTPDDEFDLAGEKGLLWDETYVAIIPLFLTADVTALFVTNADAENAAELTIVGLQDATP